jgi:hypothetical protein
MVRIQIVKPNISGLIKLESAQLSYSDRRKTVSGIVGKKRVEGGGDRVEIHKRYEFYSEVVE